MYQAKFLSPMIPSYDLNLTVSFFMDLLDFKIARREERYAILYKEHCMVHILPAGTDIGEMEFYLEVDNVDSVWSSIKDRVSGMKHKAPFDREYGMREIHIIIPQTKTLMFIGQVIKK